MNIPNRRSEEHTSELQSRRDLVGRLLLEKKKELVGSPVALNLDRELGWIVREREWEVRYFQRPVRLRDRVPVPPKGPTIAAGSVAVAIGSALVLYMWLRKR